MLFSSEFRADWKYAIPIREPGIASFNDTATASPVQPSCAAGLLLDRIVAGFSLLHHGFEEFESYALIERGGEFEVLKAAEWRFVRMRQTRHAARRMSGEPDLFPSILTLPPSIAKEAISVNLEQERATDVKWSAGTIIE
jgi:hypothetical protein